MAKKITGQDLFDVSSFDQATQQIVGLIGKINEAIKGAKGEVDKLSTKLGTDLKNQITNVSSSSDKLEKELADVKTKFGQLKTTVSTSNDVIKKYEEENKKLETQLRKVKEEATKYSNAQKEVSKSQKTSGITSAGLTQSLIGVASGAALVFKGITLLKEQLILAVKSTMEFETAMKEVQAISRASAKELEALTENANRLGATTEKTAGQIASLQKELGKLGFNTTEILASTDAIVDLSTATGEDLAGSATVAAATLRAFGLEAVEMGRVVDVMAGSFVRSGLDLEKFRESMKLVAPIARATNIDIETTTAALSKLADAGLSGSLAGTALRNLFSNMADPTSDLAKRLGFTVKNSDDLIVAFKKLRDEGVGLAEAVQLVDVRARPAFFTLLNQVEAVEQLAIEYAILDGEANNIAKTMRDTLANDVEIANSAFDALRRNVAEKLVPSMRSGAQGVATMSEFLRFLVDDLDNFIKKLEESAKSSGWGSFKAILGDLLLFPRLWSEAMSLMETNNSFRTMESDIKGTYNSLERASESLNNIKGDLEALEGVTALSSSIKKGVLDEKNWQLITQYQKILGEEFNGIFDALERGTINYEKATVAVQGQLEKNLKTTKATYEQEEQNLELLRKRLRLHTQEFGDVGSLIAGTTEFNTANTLTQQIKLTKEFLDNTSKQYKLLQTIFKDTEAAGGKLDTKIDQTATKTTDLLSLQIKYAQEVLKSDIATNKHRLENDIEITSYRRVLAEQYKNYRIELLNLELTAEENAIELSVDGAEQKAIRKLIAEEKYYRGLADLEREYNKDFRKAEENLVKEANKRGAQGIKDAKKLFEAKKEEGKKFIESIKEDSGELISEIADMVAKSLQQVSQITRSVFDNQQVARENELRSIDRWEAERVKSAGDNAEAIEAIEAEAERKRNEVRKRQAKADRTEALFQIAIQTAQGIARAVAQSPLTGGLPFSAIVAALGAAQAAVVASRPLPEFYKGTDNSPEGLAVVGDRYGRELIQDGKTGEYRVTPNKSTVQYLSEGSKVFTNKETERILSSVDHNGIAVGKLSGATQERKQPPIDYNKLGKTFEDAVTKIPVSTTNFDQNGVRTFVTKGHNRTERLNNRYKY